ncbi:homoserine kinase [Aeromicrobium senzhongii]|uniref:Homoserine kinase n=1 Tax=Aeromicrobium senzhongii TaxID=2663859 RepID=A0ABX6SQ87_9ACTN|nr:homoserine kinase [Aeromicrobium senzhongii]MTB89190.1 homoserine kinase [Aeromicrobium senzhongii]QNL93544.1 homoserine kinase [Aeromicrobium senzhongii]
MTFVDRPVTVRVPATSANLGPGFDSLGLALSWYDEVTAEVTESGLTFDIRGEGADEVPRDETHLLYRAMDAAFDLLGEHPAGVHLTCRNTIPHGRGLGSSAAAIVAGVVLARALVVGGADRLDDRTLFGLATDLEGHPDNVAPALFGGFTISWVDGAAAETLRLDVDVDVTVFVPPEAVATSVARGLLPAEVPHADASFNAGRAALLVAALTGAPERLISATEDRLHQTYRADAMPESYKLLRRLRVEGVPAVVSGAGPTVLAFAHGVQEWNPPGWAERELRVSSQGAALVP